MGKIFYAYAAQEDAPDGCNEVFLNLPATPYELLDALDKLRLDGESRAGFIVDEFYRFSSLTRFLSEPKDLYELNALAQKLSELNDRQALAFDGLLAMETRQEKAPVGLPALIDLAYSADCCHVVEDALNDSQLGRCLADNGLIPIVEDVPDSIYEFLDFEQLGRKARVEADGVFVERGADHPCGYVERHSDLVRAYQDLDLTPKAPDYTILLEVALGSRTAQLPLPSTISKMDEALHEAGARSWSQVSLRCLDCRVPRLIGAEDHAESVIQINLLAQKLADMEPQTLSAYKALLEVTECDDIAAAEHLADTLDEYIVAPQLSSPIDVAKGELSIILTEQDTAWLLPCLDLHKYGQALIERCGGMLTEYGLIERRDGRPVQAMDDQPSLGGMEVT